jgi:hypothetical protein
MDMLAESDGIAALNVVRDEPGSLPEYCLTASLHSPSSSELRLGRPAGTQRMR